MENNGDFLFLISSLVPEIFMILYYANKLNDGVKSGSSMVPKHKINNISANNKAMLIKHQYCTLRIKTFNRRGKWET